MYVRTNKKKVSPANQFSELSCFSWSSTDVNWSQYSEHSKHREIRKWVFRTFFAKLFNKDFWGFSGICANFSLQSLPIIQIQKMLLEKCSCIEISELFWIFRDFRIRNIHVHMPFLYQNLESWTPPPNNYGTFNQRIDPQRLRKMFHKDRIFYFFKRAVC